METMSSAAALKATGYAAVAALVASVGCSEYYGPTPPVGPTPASMAVTPSERPPLSNSLFVHLQASLAGLVFEATPSGPLPVSGVSVYCDACGEAGHTFATTDANGVYRFSGGVWVAPGYSTYLIVEKAGYKDPAGLPPSTWGYSGQGWRELTVEGDTWFDIELVRR